MENTSQSTGEHSATVIDRDGLNQLIDALARAGHLVIGPIVRDGAVVYEPLDTAEALPWGWSDEQSGGSYRLEKADHGEAFAHVVGPQSWKRHLYPPRQTLWTGHREGRRFTMERPPPDPKPLALIGVRACELAAIGVQDRVFGVATHEGRAVGLQQFTDEGYARRRSSAFIVAVNCGHAAATCFCAAMDTGPAVGPGYDLALTEICEGGCHAFVMTVGSSRGAAIREQITHRPATEADLAAARSATERATKSQSRTMPQGIAGTLAASFEHPRWKDVAERCLNCANCTMVCPTCFCSSVEDTTDLTGDHVERWRHWDSCFTTDFTYIHGGSIRQSGESRYRQWITHKLSHWHEQFDTSGCTGCGRCITWCPVGIDITEEAAAIAAGPGTGPGTGNRETGKETDHAAD